MGYLFLPFSGRLLGKREGNLFLRQPQKKLTDRIPIPKYKISMAVILPLQNVNKKCVQGTFIMCKTIVRQVLLRYLQKNNFFFYIVEVHLMRRVSKRQILHSMERNLCGIGSLFTHLILFFVYFIPFFIILLQKFNGNAFSGYSWYISPNHRIINEYRLQELHMNIILP